ncbi:MAG: L-threonylcarbamoyladenylate synthase [Hyphomicrobiaceae bacterium]
MIRPASADTIAEAGRLLRDGRLVAFPTETVYGLGADATNARAVAAIFAAKGRPSFNPLIVHVASRHAAAAVADLSPLAMQLAHVFWPGPLTLVARRRAAAGIADLVTAGLETVAVRVPAHRIALALLAAAAVPIAAPSANRSGHVSPTRAAHVAADLGDRVAMILDGGACEHGVESTVVDVSGDTPRLLRLGSVTAADIARVTGVLPARAIAADGRSGDGGPMSPGQLLTHYAPRARVRLGVTAPAADEALLAFGAQVPPHPGPVFNLSTSGDVVEAAANLYAALRLLDATGVASIAVMPIPAGGLGEAINDRLNRAAASRVA